MRIPSRSSEAPRPRPSTGAEILKQTEQVSDNDFYFDPERDISSETRKEMLKHLEECRGERIIDDIVLQASYSILFPWHRGELNLDETEFGAFRCGLEKWRKGDALRFSKSDLANEIVILFPHRRGELYLDEGEVKKMKDELNSCRYKNWHRFSVVAIDFLTFFPDCRDEIKLGEEEFKGIIANLEEYRNANKWFDFCFLAMRLRILFPDRSGEFQFKRTEVNRIKDLLESYRGKKWVEFAMVAKNLYILSSQRAEIDASGQLVITPRKPKIMAEPAPLPERSKAY
jgi:hypothetical protein